MIHISTNRILRSVAAIAVLAQLSGIVLGHRAEISSPIAKLAASFAEASAVAQPPAKHPWNPIFNAPPNGAAENPAAVLVRALWTESDPTLVANQLSDHPYEEVVLELIHRAHAEIAFPAPSVTVLRQIFESLILMVNKSHVRAISQLQSQLHAAFGTSTTLPLGITSETTGLDDLILTATQSSSAEPLPTLISTGVAVHRVPATLKRLIEDAAKEPGLQNEAQTILAATRRFISDQLLDLQSNNEWLAGYIKPETVDQILRTIARQHTHTPLLLAEGDANPDYFIYALADRIQKHQYSKDAVFREKFEGAHIIETNLAALTQLSGGKGKNLSQSDGIRRFFEAVLKMERKTGAKIVVYIDDLENIDLMALDALESYTREDSTNLKLILASHAEAYADLAEEIEDLPDLFETIRLAPPPIENRMLKFIDESLPELERRHELHVSESAIRAAFEYAPRLHPHLSANDGAQRILSTLIVARAEELAQNPNLSRDVSDRDVFETIRKKFGRPVDRRDVKAFAEYRDWLVGEINKEVLGQEKMVEDLVDQWISLLKNPNRRVGVIALLGPTGTGKSRAAQIFSQLVFGDTQALLQIEGNTIKDAKMGVSTVFGSGKGYVGSESAGILGDWADKRKAKGGEGVLILDDIERAHSEVLDRFMPVFDAGEIASGNGTGRILNKLMVILTSNRGEQSLFPSTFGQWTDAERRAHMSKLDDLTIKKAFQEPQFGGDTYQASPAVLARIGKFSASNPVTPALALEIATQKAERTLKGFSADYGVTFPASPEVVKLVTQYSYQAGQGARPVERAVLQILEELVSRYGRTSAFHPGESLTLTVEPKGRDSLIVLKGKNGRAEHFIPNPQPANPLDDADVLVRLANLDAEMRARIIGQDAMITRVKDAVIAHQVSMSKRPLSIFTVGTTGTGKTETAKALGRSLYQSDKRVLVLDMGRVIHEGEFNNIFGSAKGYVGSQEESQFEKFLRENPEGGVIVFDEISNMGGNDVGQKEALFKKLYALIEEGVWTSSATGKLYTLSKYTFLFTGNDLEKELQGLSDDDMRMATWNSLNSNDKIRAMLRKAGVPEAFLGRMADIILMKPLIKDDVRKISQILLNLNTTQFAERGLTFDFNNQFLNELSDTFFSHSEGARSIRNMIEHRLGSAIAQVVIKAGGASNVKNHPIALSISDNAIKRTYIQASDPTRKVELKASVTLADGTVISQVVDVTDFAPKFNLQTREQVIRTSYHEAGHAVLNDPLKTGQRVAHVTIVGKDNYLGYARYEPVHGRQPSQNEENTIYRMAQMLAGQKAETLAGYSRTSGWRSDLESARELASRFLIHWGLGEGLDAIPVDAKGEPQLTPEMKTKLQAAVDDLFTKAELVAEATLKENWNLIRGISSELYRNGYITGDRLEKIRAEVAAQAKDLPLWGVNPKTGRMSRIKRECNDLLIEE